MATYPKSEIIQTSYGKVQGHVRDGCAEFLGIPFAKPPVGELAFRHPVKPDPWDGVLEVVKGSHNPVQMKSRFGVGNCSEDCLYMNIFVPLVPNDAATMSAAAPGETAAMGAAAPGENAPAAIEGLPSNLPVMVWFFGGSYMTGGVGATREGGDTLGYDFNFFARKTNTIIVAFNYRLNFYGFMNLHYLSDRFDSNNGLYDQLLALEFVRSEIAAFGGNPENVTAFGQSAGAACVLAQMSSEKSKHLFQRAIVQSPCTDHFWTEAESQKLTKRFLNYLGLSEKQVRANPELLVNVPHEDVKAANRKLAKNVLLKGDDRCAFSPVIDGEFLTDYPSKLAASATHDMLIGYTTREGSLFIQGYPTIALHYLAWHGGHKVPKGPEPYARRFENLLTNHIYRDPIVKLADAYRGKAWVYLFGYVTKELEELGLGACHVSELFVLFHGKHAFCDPDDPTTFAVGERLRKIWKDFAYGELQEEPYEPEKYIIKIDGPAAL